jgi:copper oxidase (laccase) domain-containing protein
MNSAFEVVVHRGVQLLVYRPWWEGGIVHGMTLRELDFGNRNARETLPRFSEMLEVDAVMLPSQTHSALVFDLRSPETVAAYRSQKQGSLTFAECDAVVAPVEQHVPGVRTAFGVRTADCVPLIVRAQSGWGVIHAGWRGLATGIIANTVMLLEGVEEVAIFAAAGSRRYEVGPEVIEQIGESAVHVPVPNTQRALLDTAATAAHQVRACAPLARVAVAEICSIEDERFHSYRRDGDAAGRSLTFVVP